jgi:hypothetical protein
MAGIEINGSVPDLVQGTIGTNGTLSEEADLTGYTFAGLEIDNATNGTLTFWVSHQKLSLGNTYRPVYNSDGTQYSLTLPTGNVAFSASTIVNVIAPYRYVRLVTSVAQSSAPTFRWVVKA